MVRDLGSLAAFECPGCRTLPSSEIDARVFTATHVLCCFSVFFTAGSKQEVKMDAITDRLRALMDGLDTRYIDPVSSPRGS